MQIVQENLDRLVINIVPGADFDAKSTSILCQYFENLFGENTDIKINRLKSIVPEKSGKYRFSICKI
jgi:phenylacetate-CoA ligase